MPINEEGGNSVANLGSLESPLRGDQIIWHASRGVLHNSLENLIKCADYVIPRQDESREDFGLM